MKNSNFQKISTLRELVKPNKACYTEYLLLAEANHFNVFNRPEICDQLRPMHRSDFYKISLIVGKGILQIREEYIEINGSVLIFFNPELPYYWHSLSEQEPSYYCYFDNHFVSKFLNSDYFKDSPLFNLQVFPLTTLTDEQARQVKLIFEKMLEEVACDYHHKYDILNTYLQLLIQEAFKFSHSSSRTSANGSASTRIASGFLNLLERQFPIDSVVNPLQLKSPGDFANQLAVHVNHLNHAVKEVTGKNTTEIIASRMANEAKALLKHSNASISEIAYSLGFEHPSSFNTFFKKLTKDTPKFFRKNQQVSIPQD